MKVAFRQLYSLAASLGLMTMSIVLCLCKWPGMQGAAGVLSGRVWGDAEVGTSYVELRRVDRSFGDDAPPQTRKTSKGAATFG